MKKIMTTAALALAVLSAGAQDTAYKITGTVPSDVKKVYIISAGQRAPFDSVAVVNGKFELNGTKPLNDVFNIVMGNYYLPLFNDGMPVDVNTVTKTLQGSELNKKLYEYDKALTVYGDQMNELYGQYHEAMSDTTVNGKVQLSILKAQFEKLNDDYMTAQLKIVKDNKDNLIPAVYLGQLSYGLDYNELKELLPETAPYYNHPSMKVVKAQLAALEKRMPGKMFTDLSMNDTEGQPRKLSDWCGKGNYVLVDFWASWCGPCRQEMPNVVENYKKYHAKGFEVVGVSFDQNGEAWKAAIKQIGMEWPNISDLKGWRCAAAPVYGINSIPANILLDGEGKIVASDLRGEALGEKLEEVYGF